MCPMKRANDSNCRSLTRGIDIIAQTHEGEYWAVQAKYRVAMERRSHSGELSTFVSLAFTVCSGFSFARSYIPQPSASPERFTAPLRLDAARSKPGRIYPLNFLTCFERSWPVIASLQFRAFRNFTNAARLRMLTNTTLKTRTLAESSHHAVRQRQKPDGPLD